MAGPLTAKMRMKETGVEAAAVLFLSLGSDLWGSEAGLQFHDRALFGSRSSGWNCIDN